MRTPNTTTAQWFGTLLCCVWEDEMRTHLTGALDDYGEKGLQRVRSVIDMVPMKHTNTQHDNTQNHNTQRNRTNTATTNALPRTSQPTENFPTPGKHTTQHTDTGTPPKAQVSTEPLANAQGDSSDAAESTAPTTDEVHEDHTTPQHYCENPLNSTERETATTLESEPRREGDAEPLADRPTHTNTCGQVQEPPVPETTPRCTVPETTPGCTDAHADPVTAEGESNIGTETEAQCDVTSTPHEVEPPQSEEREVSSMESDEAPGEKQQE